MELPNGLWFALKLLDEHAPADIWLFAVFPKSFNVAIIMNLVHKDVILVHI